MHLVPPPFFHSCVFQLGIPCRKGKEKQKKKPLPMKDLHVHDQSEPRMRQKRRHDPCMKVVPSTNHSRDPDDLRADSPFPSPPPEGRSPAVGLGGYRSGRKVPGKKANEG